MAEFVAGGGGTFKGPSGERVGDPLILSRRWTLAQARQAVLTDEMGTDCSPSHHLLERRSLFGNALVGKVDESVANNDDPHPKCLRREFVRAGRPDPVRANALISVFNRSQVNTADLE